MTNRAAELLHAQCWLWGQDLRSPVGDLLAACGLESRAIAGARSHRRYYVESLTAGRFAAAWSGGLFFGDGGGALFFPRLRFTPAAITHIQSADDLGNLNACLGAPPADADARVETLTRAAIDWLAGYETRVVHLAGAEWRARCAEVWAETEAQAVQLAASLGVEYAPLPPLPAAGLGEPWHDLVRTTEERTSGR